MSRLTRIIDDILVTASLFLRKRQFSQTGEG
jgi:hypothetical protein